MSGSTRNIFFPFDILHDTSMDVAIEMVKELEITDWEPIEIAGMIDGEISGLMPHWKKWDLHHSEVYNTVNHQEEYDELPRHLHSFSSCSSSQASLAGLMTHGYEWLQGTAPTDLTRMLLTFYNCLCSEKLGKVLVKDIW